MRGKDQVEKGEEEVEEDEDEVEDEEEVEDEVKDEVEDEVEEEEDMVLRTRTTMPSMDTKEDRSMIRGHLQALLVVIGVVMEAIMMVTIEVVEIEVREEEEGTFMTLLRVVGDMEDKDMGVTVATEGNQAMIRDMIVVDQWIGLQVPLVDLRTSLVAQMCGKGM